MELLSVPVPLFDNEMKVEAYLLQYCLNKNLRPQEYATFYGHRNRSPMLEIVNTVGLESLSFGKRVLLPIPPELLANRPEQQCSVPSHRVVFLLEEQRPLTELQLEGMQRLMRLGFRFAARNLVLPHHRATVLPLCDYLLVGGETAAQMTESRLRRWQTKYRNLQLVRTEIADTAQHQSISRTATYQLYHGSFYQTPVCRPAADVLPVKKNLIRLLNTVRSDFEFRDVVEIIQQDTALSLSLLQLINSPFFKLRQKVKSIQHAVTLLGQNEVRKWVTVTVSRQLFADKPSEISRLSLTRAKFAENLADHFAIPCQEAFLMGLFSVLDVVLDCTMSEALRRLQLSDEIREGLLLRSGPFGTVFSLMTSYETAEWGTLARLCSLNSLHMEEVNHCYLQALYWYRDLITDQFLRNDNESVG